MSAAENERDGRHARWDDHREQRRRLILDAAADVVAGGPLGAELRLQDVAQRAGLVRTVVQRHFGGQAGLLRAVQADVLQQAFALITAPVDLGSSLHDVVAAMVGTTIDWVEDHPCLHALVEREVGDGDPSELSVAVASYAEFLSGVVQQVAGLAGVTLSPPQVEEVRLLSVGIVGQVRATVAAWVAQDSRLVSATQLRERLAAWISAEIALQMASVGLRLEVSAPLTAAVADLNDPVSSEPTDR